MRTIIAVAALTLLFSTQANAHYHSGPWHGGFNSHHGFHHGFRGWGFAPGWHGNGCHLRCGGGRCWRTCWL